MCGEGGMCVCVCVCVSGVCMARGVWVAEGHAWQGGCAWWGCAWQGACMSGGIHGRGGGIHGRGGGMHGRGGGMHGRGACVAGETATATGATHPTGMHSFVQWYCVIAWSEPAEKMNFAFNIAQKNPLMIVFGLLAVFTLFANSALVFLKCSQCCSEIRPSRVTQK